MHTPRPTPALTLLLLRGRTPAPTPRTFPQTLPTAMTAHPGTLYPHVTVAPGVVRDVAIVCVAWHEGGERTRMEIHVPKRLVTEKFLRFYERLASESERAPLQLVK